MEDSVRQYLREIGKRGGKSLLKKYGKGHMSRLGSIKKEKRSTSPSTPSTESAEGGQGKTSA